MIRFNCKTREHFAEKKVEKVRENVQKVWVEDGNQAGHSILIGLGGCESWRTEILPRTNGMFPLRKMKNSFAGQSALDNGQHMTKIGNLAGGATEGGRSLG